MRSVLMRRRDLSQHGTDRLYVRGAYHRQYLYYYNRQESDLSSGPADLPKAPSCAQHCQISLQTKVSDKSAQKQLRVKGGCKDAHADIASDNARHGDTSACSKFTDRLGAYLSMLRD